MTATEVLAFVSSSIRVATPLALAATGEAISERAGVVNVGVEGIMLAGALAAFLATNATGSPLAGVALALLLGLALALLFAGFALLVRADQVVLGLGLNLVAFGSCGAVYRLVVGDRGSDVQVAALEPWGVPLLREIPLLGPALFVQEPLAWATLGIVLAAAWVLARSTWGVSLRATGDEPRAAEAAGISVLRVRLAAVVAGGLLAALAGADLVLAHARTFAEDLTSGRGFMALAIVLFGRWSPGRVALAALFFGAAQAFEAALQAQGITVAGYPLGRAKELVLALPYLLTLAVLALRRPAKRGDEPSALGVPYAGQS